ncbi:MAG TPA: Asp-tRNA(Asn)/Glu-tRNA(Gln) amidotransferase subunit GatB [Thermomicrobiales bacterium]|nr:Asp-tRNA(Asn)/Glu-tRNA(Gln) amidotransferase subunit GatB [Thermomicrobiales bacterium]
MASEMESSAGYEIVIGLEVHAQVLTASKMFCGCPAVYADTDPNSSTCPVCLGLPGALPVMNAAAVRLVLATGLALGCSIPHYSKQDRKSYFYPDLPKGYQISQYDLPLCVDGCLRFLSGGEERAAGIIRVHMEEDTGRLLHRSTGTGIEESLVDLNRSGVPLMEIVGEPDLRSPEEARDYLEALRQLLRYIGASTANMEEGAFRCDANVSVRRKGDPGLGAKVEIKNLNSFRAVQRALKFEEQRQSQALDAGRPILQETRGWVEDRGVTVGQRTKEHAHDYRYFPEPDLPPLKVGEATIAAVRAALPELPLARRRRFVGAYGLSESDAALLTAEWPIADTFEMAVGSDPTPERARAAANWIINDLAGISAQRGAPADTLPITAHQLRELLDMIDSRQITVRAAKELVVALEPGESPRDGAVRLSLLVLDDHSAIVDAVEAVMAAFPEAVEDYRRGKQAAIGRLIGETMKRTGGRASPDLVRKELQAALAGGPAESRV